MRLTLTESLPPQPPSIGEARQMLAVLLSLTNADERSCYRLAVLLTEACANVVQHGEPGTALDLHIAIEAGTCVLEVGNRGRVPNGGTFPALPLDPEQTSGRGLALIAAMSDRAEFVPTAPGCVLLRMTLALPGHPDARAAGRSGP
ncbi:ATP-binding protein [Dactylosporangium sp. CA-139066]|uniref:ATP-binding protein n=1 Tax=Dactylosporangium sp. CA-139066 TaxID=3239930 RepID=UPI003D932206